MEKFKTLLLIILVAASLFQSYVLSYSTPKFEPINNGQYVEAEINGTQAKLEDVIFPDQIILHFGQKQHTVLYPMTYIYPYRNIFDFFKNRTFDGLRLTNVYTANLDWDKIREYQEGIEIEFREGVPLKVLQGFMAIRTEDASLANDPISRILIYKNADDEVKTFFISDTNHTLYEAVKADVTVRDLEVKLKLGESLPKYHTVSNGRFYLPNETLSAYKIIMPYTTFTPEQLKRSLFVDPSLTRTLTERDGSQIYTDGKRGLQLRGNAQWFIYSDPVSAPASSKNDVQDNLLSALQFVNQHGGWNSTYLYSRMSTVQDNGPQTYLFRQYLDGYPVVNVKKEEAGYIKVVAQKGFVFNYERSMVITDESRMVKTDALLSGGEVLDRMLAGYGKRYDVVRLFPGYRAFVKKNEVEYIPAWFVELMDGTFDML